MKKKRIRVVKVNITGEITPETLTAMDGNGNSLVEILRECNRPDVRLEIMLSSPGGDIDVGMTIYEMLLTTRAQVSITGYGIVASIAVLIFMGGEERILTPGTRMFVHPGSVMSPTPESIFTLSSKAVELQHLHKWYCEQIFNGAVEGKINIEKVFELCNKDSFFSAYEALDLGIATKIELYER